MTKPYTKRMKGNWNQGKRCKGDAEERQYAKAEIKQELEANDENYLVKHKGKKKKNEKARLEHWIDWYEKTIQEYERRGTGHGSHPNYLRDSLRKAKMKLEKLKP